jgi:hypothetical protein
VSVKPAAALKGIFTMSGNPFDLLSWSPWIPHYGCWSSDLIPNTAGLYRIRRVNGLYLDYIGQSGGGANTLRKRMGALSGVYREEMPYTDPHTAAPALWALRSSLGVDFEVSVANVSCSDQIRKGLETMVIALYRQEHGCSPTANFGRIPVGFRKSSGVSRKLAAAGRQIRGGKSESQEPHHAPSVPPIALLGGDPQSLQWSGHKWSDWQSISPTHNNPLAGAAGLYRIRDATKPGLLYIGEGQVASRLADHVKMSKLCDNRKGKIFAEAEQLEASWVLNHAWLPNQRLELECDLIGAYVLTSADVPQAQFGGPAE